MAGNLGKHEAPSTLVKTLSKRQRTLPFMATFEFSRVAKSENCDDYVVTFLDPVGNPFYKVTKKVLVGKIPYFGMVLRYSNPNHETREIPYQSIYHPTIVRALVHGELCRMITNVPLFMRDEFFGALDILECRNLKSRFYFLTSTKMWNFPTVLLKMENLFYAIFFRPIGIRIPMEFYNGIFKSERRNVEGTLRPLLRIEESGEAIVTFSKGFPGMFWTSESLIIEALYYTYHGVPKESNPEDADFFSDLIGTFAVPALLGFYEFVDYLGGLLLNMGCVKKANLAVLMRHVFPKVNSWISRSFLDWVGEQVGWYLNTFDLKAREFFFGEDCTERHIFLDAKMPKLNEMCSYGDYREKIYIRNFPFRFFKAASEADDSIWQEVARCTRRFKRWNFKSLSYVECGYEKNQAITVDNDVRYFVRLCETYEEFETELLKCIYGFEKEVAENDQKMFDESDYDSSDDE